MYLSEQYLNELFGFGIGMDSNLQKYRLYLADLTNLFVRIRNENTDLIVGGVVDVEELYFLPFSVRTKSELDGISYNGGILGFSTFVGKTMFPNKVQEFFMIFFTKDPSPMICYVGVDYHGNDQFKKLDVVYDEANDKITKIINGSFNELKTKNKYKKSIDLFKKGSGYKKINDDLLFNANKTSSKQFNLSDKKLSSFTIKKNIRLLK